jgi:hypothetical protein
MVKHIANLQVAKYCSGSLRKRQVSFSQRKYRHSESRVHSLCRKALNQGGDIFLYHKPYSLYIMFELHIIITLKGVCHEIVVFRYFMNQFPPGP